MPPDVDGVRVPVAFLWVRGDRAGPGRLFEEQVVASYAYWNDDSGRHLDVVLPGWGKDGDVVVFDRAAFLSFRGELEEVTKWRYGGETELLICSYDCKLNGYDGDFAFDQAVQLPVETMVRDGRIPHLDALMHELVAASKADDVASVWTIASRIATDRGRNGIWRLLREKFLRDANKLYDELRPFVVCDLSGR